MAVTDLDHDESPTPTTPTSDRSNVFDDHNVNKQQPNKYNMNRYADTAAHKDIKLDMPPGDQSDTTKSIDNYDWIRDRLRLKPENKFCNQTSPLNNISWLQTVYCGFMTPMILLGRKRAIELSDVWEPVDEDKTDYTVELIRTAWNKQLEKQQKNPKYKPSLFWALFDIYGISFILTAFSEALYYGFQMIQPFALKALILYVEQNQTNTLGGAKLSVWYALILAGTVLFCSFAINYKFYRIYRFGCQMRSGLMGIIYDKALKLSAGSRTTSTIGQTMNIVSNDTSRIFDASLFVNTIFVAPIILAVTMGLLGWQIGVCHTIVYSHFNTLLVH